MTNKVDELGGKASFLFAVLLTSGIIHPQSISLKSTGVNRNHFILLKLRPLFLMLIAGICLLVAEKNTYGQEALRMSLAGEQAAESQREAASSIGYYNLLLGPTAWRFSSSLGLEFNDNVRLQTNGSSDFILRPSVNTQMHWPVTLKNSLDVSLGVGYSEYFENQDLSQFFINPGSGLSFDVYVGDFKINLHDRITITQNAYENTGSGGNRNLVSLQNTLGTSALWDLDKVVSNLGYDHVNYASLSQGQSSGRQPDTTIENFSANTGVRIRPELTLGLEAGESLISYSQSGSTNSQVYPSAQQWSVGAYVEAQISDYINARLDGGYQDYSTSSSGTATNQTTGDKAGSYFTFSLTHRVNQSVNYTLTAGQSTDLSAYGQAHSYYYIRLTPNWNFFQKYSISTPVWWQQGSRVYKTSTSDNSNYDQLGLGLNVQRSLTKKLSAGINYQFVQETSNAAELNYKVNEVGLNLSYQF